VPQFEVRAFTAACAHDSCHRIATAEPDENNDMITTANIVSELQKIAKQYPPELVKGQWHDVNRIAFNINLVMSRKGSNCRICDLGGGIGLFSVGCAALGMKSILVDDFSDAINKTVVESVLDIHKSHGVTIISRDVIRDGIEFPAGSLDAITTFDSMEHWHHSPKRLFSSVVKILASGGLFVLSAPNCVNLRKRITVPLGIGASSQMVDWYEPDLFRGHVREPSKCDLAYIANDMKLVNVSLVGRNWLGYNSRYGVVRALMPFGDPLLGLFPSLCSNMYLIGTKP
jgi:2-polyprenyl-3-methyl-5-hydroxy-6-metoxy-1,4-benzoquinol methylase